MTTLSPDPTGRLASPTLPAPLDSPTLDPRLSRRAPAEEVIPSEATAAAREFAREGYTQAERVVILIAVVGPLIATLYAIVLLWQRAVDWQDLALLGTMFVATGFGVTVGYHRMLTHRAFASHPAVRFVFLALASMAAEGGALTWASTHLKHHAYSDRDGDPHSPLDGFFHSHVGWILDGWAVEPEKHGPWLAEDRMVVFFERTFMLWVAAGLALVYAIGGWTGLLWGGAVRIFLTHHVTWSVNSVCHTFGSRTFDTKDQSRNQWVVGLLAFGEGWHNNHHAFPRSAFHGLRPTEVDTSGYLIRILERLGLVWDVQRVSPDAVARRRG